MVAVEPIVRSDRLDALLAPYAERIGDDLPGYRNHVLRVLSYAMHFLGQDAAQRPLVETALAYHDIGLWTDRELAYLEPSEAAALADNARLGWGLDPDLLRAAIHWHHKVFPYAGAGERLVNAVRRADWVDATKGKVRHGLARSDIAAVEAAIPNEGFHDTLQRLAAELGGSAIRGNLRVLTHVFKL